MPFPQHSNKHEYPTLLAGRHIVDYRRSKGILPNGEAPESVLFCLETSLPKQMRRAFPFRNAGRLAGDLLRLRAGGGKVGIIVNCGVGAPAVVGIAEELLGWGTRNFALLSWAGGLQSTLENGTMVVVNKAIRDDGVSHHYLPDGKYATSQGTLTAQLVNRLTATNQPHQLGSTWSTAAPYRETEAEVATYQAEGVLAVEMEIAGLFAFGQVHQVSTLAAVVVGDSLGELKWQPPHDTQRIYQSLERLYSAILESFLKV